MTKFFKKQSDYSFWLLNAAAYLTWLGVLIPMLPNIVDSPHRTSILVLFGLFFIGLSAYGYLEKRPFLVHLYLLFQSIVIWNIFILAPGYGTVNSSILFFVLSAYSMLFLSLIPGLLWIMGFAVITWYGGVLAFGVTSPVGLISVMGGYLFFGTFGTSLRHANEASQKSQQLLADLQQAHEQLQAYTAQAQQLAASEERNRLAREMHDALGHRLTVAVVQLEGAQRLIPTEPERSASMIDTMRTQLKQALAELRQTVSALRSPNSLPGLSEPLQTAVSHLAHTFQEATRLPIHLNLPEKLPPLPQSHQLALYRAAQESLTNVQRHANAQQAWLSLSASAEQITLTVTDDGQGFNDEMVNGRFGLVGLRERAKQLGGSLQFSSATEGGAMLRLQLPIPSSTGLISFPEAANV